MKKQPLDNVPTINFTHQLLKSKKIIDISDWSVYQLIEQYNETDEGKPRSYRATKKADATLFEKKFKLLSVEHLSFLINGAGWKVTNLNSHYSFDQERFKRNFILMNQKSRQNAKNSIENFLFKLMSNANFGYDCYKNLDNCQFIPFLMK